MESQDVVTTLDALAAAGIHPVLEGGWANDALVGHQTRPHGDLDIAISEQELQVCIHVLGELGFAEQAGDMPAHLIMRASDGREVDVHPLAFDEAGNGWQQLTNDGAWGLYPADGLTGIGSIESRRVRCTTPELQVRHHLGYPLTEKDITDLRLLHREFGVAVHPPCFEA